jgi:DNA-binding transcriptional LysR family regulator
MELKWLEDLLVLLEEKSITRAALRRHVTQPAYSRRIRQLETWLGVEIVDRSTKPIKILNSGLALEEEVKDLVNRFYGLRNTAQANVENQNQITVIAQHTLAITRFPQIVTQLKKRLPNIGYRVVPANNDECETAFLKGAEFLLCYETPVRRFDFSNLSVRRLNLGKDRLLPVATRNLADQLGELEPGMTIPVLLYQKGGFFADQLASSCLPKLMRNYRLEVICESAFSASLKELLLADMGIAWLAREMIEDGLVQGSLVSYESVLGFVDMDITLYYQDLSQNSRAREVFENIPGI